MDAVRERMCLALQGCDAAVGLSGGGVGMGVFVVGIILPFALIPQHKSTTISNAFETLE